MIREPDLIAAFAKLWETSDLLVSFDGMNLTLPDKSRKQSHPWPHVDQSPDRPGLQCVQGILNLAPNGPKDGGLVVLQKSHSLNQEFFEQNLKISCPENWFSFQDKQIKWFEKKGCTWKKVSADAGDLILWDSRTIHYNVLPMGDALRAVMCESPVPAD
jgi:ectoine hydroxylase-related dioxygenase (phytanoyl-CoA dioxygenase family)